MTAPTIGDHVHDSLAALDPDPFRQAAIWLIFRDRKDLLDFKVRTALTNAYRKDNDDR